MIAAPVSYCQNRVDTEDKDENNWRPKNFSPKVAEEGDPRVGGDPEHQAQHPHSDPLHQLRHPLQHEG